MSEQEKTPPVFVDGLNIKLPSEKAPTWILLQMGFNAHKFFQWCQEHQDDKGWVNITIKKSQKGSIYGELDTWKPHIESRGLPSLAEIGEAKSNINANPALTLDDLDVSQPVGDIPF